MSPSNKNSWMIKDKRILRGSLMGFSPEPGDDGIQTFKVQSAGKFNEPAELYGDFKVIDSRERIMRPDSFAHGHLIFP